LEFGVSSILSRRRWEQRRGQCNTLEAFKNEIEALRGNKISDDAADLLIAFTDNLIAQLQLLL